jgi:hypothetical protein
MAVSSTQLRPALIAALLGTAGCPGTLDDPSRFLVDGLQTEGGDEASACPDVPTAVFAPACATAGCHSTADKVQGLDLQSTGLSARLVGVPAQGGGLLIDPLAPTQSILYLKMTSTPPFGARMPLAKAPLDDTTLACTLGWIAEQTGAIGYDAGPPDATADDAGIEAAVGLPDDAGPKADGGDAGRD